LKKTTDYKLFCGEIMQPKFNYRWVISLILILLACISPPIFVKTPNPIPVSVPTPSSINYFGATTSGNVAYTVGTLVSGVCRELCSYKVSTILPAGYDQARIFLTGWHVENLSRATTLHRLHLSSDMLSYNPTNGKFVWQATADVRFTNDIEDQYRFTLFFTIVLVKTSAAKLTVLPIGCSSSGTGICNQNSIVSNILPAGWELAALGVSMFQLEAGINGILLNRLALDASNSSPSGADLNAAVQCEMFDATPTEPMSCMSQLVAVITAPGETYHVHFQSGHASTKFFSSSYKEPPPGEEVDGGFGGFDRFLLTFPSGQESTTWSWAADYNDISLCPDLINFCYNRFGFLGDTSGSQNNTLTFNIELSGFAVWTRPP